MRHGRTASILEAMLVTFLWSSSFIFIKYGLDSLGPMTFAAYRYVLAASVLLAYALLRHRQKMFSLEKETIVKYVLLGFCGYFIAQGLQFFGLYYLPAITVTFILNMTPLLVLLLSLFVLREVPRKRQAIGIILTLMGIAIFFSGEDLQFDERLGVLLTFVSGVGWAAYMVITRYTVRASEENLVVMTSISMFAGAIMLFVGSVLTEGLDVPTAEGSLIIIWLAVANTALAFFLWNRALVNLKAYEQSILQNTMLIQISVLAMVFLGERISLIKLLGICMVFFGVLIVVLKEKRDKVRYRSELA